MNEVLISPGKAIKLVVWNLADTLGGAAPGAVAPAVRQLIATLDERGIMQSVVSGGDAAPAWRQLEQHGVAEYFLYPQLAARETSVAVGKIADALNIAIDATLLISGAPGDHDEVARVYPGVRAVPPAAVERLADDPLMGRSLAALEPRPRRLLYVEEQARSAAERAFVGERADFLASLGMELAVAPAERADLHRIRELVNRANQLGATFTDDELERMRSAPDHACLLVSLTDRFGDCGKVGIAVVELAADRWTLKLLLFSCRVMPRGVSTLVLEALLREARAAGVRFFSLLRPTSKNAAMASAYEAAGFTPVAPGVDGPAASEAIEGRLAPGAGELVVLEHTRAEIPGPARGVRLTLALSRPRAGSGA